MKHNTVYITSCWLVGKSEPPLGSLGALLANNLIPLVICVQFNSCQGELLVSECHSCSCLYLEAEIVDDRTCEFLNFIGHSLYTGFIKCPSAYLVMVGKLNLSFPIFSEFLVSCYMSCCFSCHSHCSQSNCSVILFLDKIISFILSDGTYLV